MALTFDCPEGAAIPDVPISDCPVSIGQIQKILLQRKFANGTTLNKFVKNTANPNLKASWIPKLSATNGTKVVQSPYIQGPSIVAGKARSYGGGNETVGGIPVIIGKEPSVFTGKLLQQSQNTIEALQAFMGENVTVWLVDEHGRIWGTADDIQTPTEYFPIPIAALFVGDLTDGKIDAVGENEITWQMFPGWSNKLVPITPTDFNALTDLVTIIS